MIPTLQELSPWRFCIAPMMQYTDRHFRFFARLMSVHCRLYTEMVVSGAILHGDRERFLQHSAAEHPVALQLGGCDPTELAQAAAIGEAAGYCEINLNVGCPSDRVKSGRFGAALMAEPQLVADCYRSMAEAVDIPVTIKTRIGIDRSESYDELTRFVDEIYDAGCRVFIVHARKAWLDGLSPRENREIPPLRYDRVHRLKSDFPDATIVINGGLKTLADSATHLNVVDGVMLGRATYNTPYMLADVDSTLFGSDTSCLSRQEYLTRYTPYVAMELSKGTYLRHLVKPLHHLFQGEPGAKRWRRALSEQCSTSSATFEHYLHVTKTIECAVNC